MGKRSLTILMISSGFYPKVDGTTLAIGNLIQSLMKRGHKVILVTRKYKISPRYERWFSIPVIRVGPSGSSFFSRFILALNQIHVSVIEMMREHVDIVHVHGFAPLLPGLALRAIFRKPVVVTFHGFQSLWDRGTRWRSESTYKAIRPFRKIMISRTNAIIAQSTKLKEVIIRLYNTQTGKIHVIPHPIDEEVFEPNPKPSAKEPIVLFVGTLGRVYGADLFIKSAKYTIRNVPKVKFLIVGKGPLKGDLEKLAEDLNVKNTVGFVGPIYDRRELAKLYCSAKVIVIPLRYEGYILSLVALEAMATGRPVVTTLTLDSELYDAGIFKSSLDPKEIAKRVVEILAMTEREYAELSKAIRANFEARYSSSSVISKIEELYLELTTR